MSTGTGVSVRVRGVIYSTALTKLFLERGFDIAQPSNRIVERFNIEKTYEEFDVDVYDKRDHHGGVILVGTKVEEVKAALEDELVDVFFRRLPPYQLYGIYKGIIVKKDERYVYVDIGSAIGTIPAKELPRAAEGDEVLVQVKKHNLLPPSSASPLPFPAITRF